MLDENLFANGKITYNACEEFMKWTADNPDKNGWYYQSLLQVAYEQILLDIEWNDYFKMFVIQVIENEEWETFIEKRLCPNLNSLEKNVAECVKNIKKIMERD